MMCRMTRECKVSNARIREAVKVRKMVWNE